MGTRLLGAVLFVSSLAAAQNRLLVPTQYPTLAAAVAAAVDGDTIQLASGVQNTGSAVITKSLDIVGASTILNGSLTITVPAGKALTMTGCLPGAAPPTAIAMALITITHSVGRVALIDDGPTGWGSLQILDSTQVLLRNFGFDNPYPRSGPGPAVLVQNSTASFDNCILHGFPAEGWSGGAPATHALQLVSAQVSLSHSTLIGGNGSNFKLRGFAPGTGALSAANSILRCSRSITMSTGAMGTDPALSLNGGLALLDGSFTPTTALSNGAVVVRAPTPIVLASNVSAGRVASFTLFSTTGTLGALLVGVAADRLPVPGVIGDLWLDRTAMCVPRIGVQNGAFTWTTPVPAVWPFPAEFRWQGLVLDSGTLTLTDPGAALLH